MRRNKSIEKEIKNLKVKKTGHNGVAVISIPASEPYITDEEKGKGYLAFEGLPEEVNGKKPQVMVGYYDRVEENTKIRKERQDEIKKKNKKKKQI